jgi:hypothetical protein
VSEAEVLEQQAGQADVQFAQLRQGLLDLAGDQVKAPGTSS